MAVLNFIKSLFLPRQMQKHRYMSVLFAICLFVLSAYFLLLPAKYYYKHNTQKLIDNNNLAYLQAIKEIPTLGDDVTVFVNDIKNLGVKVNSNNLLEASNLGVFNINVNSDFLGYITINKESNFWYFNSVNTEVAVNSEVNDKPLITAVDGAIIINNTTTKPIAIDGLTSDKSIDVITVTITTEGKLKVNDRIYDAYIFNDTIFCAKEDNLLVVNGIKTEYPISDAINAIIYFIPSEQTYYESTFSYKGEDNYQKNIKFVINLNEQMVSKVPYNLETEKNADLDNQEYFYIVMDKAGIYYQAHIQGIDEKNIKHNDQTLACYAFNSEYSNYPLDLTTVTVGQFGTLFTNCFRTGYTTMAISNFTLIALLYLVIFTLVISLLFSLLFKKNGKLKTFKEYYNIASLANLVPLFITFIFMWFNPGWFGTVYLVTFSLYYLFVLYRINSSSEMV